MQEELHKRIHHLRPRLEFVAGLLDDRFRIPGTQIRFGWDAILGLLPAGGDALGALFSFYFLIEAALVGAPLSVIFRILFYIWVDTVFGSIPFLGDVFDVFWKSNRKSAELIERYLEKPYETKLHSRVFIAGILSLAFISIGILLLAVAFSLHWLWEQWIHA